MSILIAFCSHMKCNKILYYLVAGIVVFFVLFFWMLEVL